MDTYILIFELVGTISFAASGALTGIRKRLDLLGVCIIGLTTAVGGGIIRDLVLGNIPPATFRNPLYAMVALITSLLVFSTHVRKILFVNHTAYNLAMILMDTAGLGIFSVIGVRVAKQTLPEAGLFLLVFVGVLTGVGGGLMRDIFIRDMPYIFIKHVYASASIIGTVICALMWDTLGESVSMLTGCIIISVIRLLSATFHWNLPRSMDV